MPRNAEDYSTSTLEEYQVEPVDHWQDVEKRYRLKPEMFQKLQEHIEATAALEHQGQKTGDREYTVHEIAYDKMSRSQRKLLETFNSHVDAITNGNRPQDGSMTPDYNWLRETYVNQCDLPPEQQDPWVREIQEDLNHVVNQITTDNSQAEAKLRQFHDHQFPTPDTEETRHDTWTIQRWQSEDYRGAAPERRNRYLAFAKEITSNNAEALFQLNSYADGQGSNGWSPISDGKSGFTAEANSLQALSSMTAPDSTAEFRKNNPEDWQTRMKEICGALQECLDAARQTARIGLAYNRENILQTGLDLNEKVSQAIEIAIYQGDIEHPINHMPPVPGDDWKNPERSVEERIEYIDSLLAFMDVTPEQETDVRETLAYNMAIRDTQAMLQQIAWSRGKNEITGQDEEELFKPTNESPSRYRHGDIQYLLAQTYTMGEPERTASIMRNLDEERRHLTGTT